ncbi:MAG: hypothetical protein JW894_07960 [Bacteroidales bacterium]|nr:hypothetical protein [Bacteroidales bacterium]
MSSNHDEIIAELRNNLKKIIGLYQQQKIDSSELKKKNEELIRDNELLKKENEELLNNYENKKLAVAFTGASGNNHDAKIKVNRVVREIDKCIALLNK